MVGREYYALGLVNVIDTAVLSVALDTAKYSAFQQLATHFRSYKTAAWQYCQTKCNRLHNNILIAAFDICEPP